jgi:hypothetical protein
MEDTTNEASVPRENASNNSRAIRAARMSGTMVRRIGTRFFPWSNAAEANLTFPRSPLPLLLQDKDLPLAKRPRLWASTADRFPQHQVQVQIHTCSKSRRSVLFQYPCVGIDHVSTLHSRNSGDNKTYPHVACCLRGATTCFIPLNSDTDESTDHRDLVPPRH